MIIRIPKTSDKLKDNRKLEMKGMLSKPGDIQEAYRELCAEYGLSLGKMYSFTKSNTNLDIRGLLMLCKRLDCIFVIDNHLDFFFIKYAPKGVSMVDVTEFITKHEQKALDKKKPSNPDDKLKTPPVETESDRFKKVEEETVEDDEGIDQALADQRTAEANASEDDEEELF